MLRLSDGAETATALLVGLGHGGAAGLGSAPVSVVAGRRRRAACCSPAPPAATRDRRRAFAAAAPHLRRHGGVSLGRGAGGRWLADRFRHPYLRDGLLDAGYATETLETAAPWSQVAPLRRHMVAALEHALAGAADDGGDEDVVVLCHLSHPYRDGASLYFTCFFRVPPEPAAAVARWATFKRAANAALVAHGATTSPTTTASAAGTRPGCHAEIGDGRRARARRRGLDARPRRHPQPARAARSGRPAGVVMGRNGAPEARGGRRVRSAHRLCLGRRRDVRPHVPATRSRRHPWSRAAVRPGGRRRRHHRLRRAARRRAARAAGAAGGEGRPRLRHLVALVEAHPRRPALPQADAAAHHPPRLPRARPPARSSRRTWCSRCRSSTRPTRATARRAGRSTSGCGCTTGSPSAPIATARSSRARRSAWRPGSSVEGLDRALLYGDALADDARLTVAVAATAAGLRRLGADARRGDRRPPRRRGQGRRRRRARPADRRGASPRGGRGAQRHRPLDRRVRERFGLAGRAAASVARRPPGAAGVAACRSRWRSPSPRPTTAGRCSSSRIRRACSSAPPTSSTTARSTTRGRRAPRSTTCCGWRWRRSPAASPVRRKCAAPSPACGRSCRATPTRRRRRAATRRCGRRRGCSTSPAAS